MNRDVLIQQTYQTLAALDTKINLIWEKLEIVEDMPVVAGKARDAELAKLKELQRFDAVLDVIITHLDKATARIASTTKLEKVIKQNTRSTKD